MILGVIGCGAIGTRIVAEALKIASVDRVLIHDRHMERAAALAGGNVEAVGLDELLGRADLVVEAATPGIVRQVLEVVLGRGADLMVMSSGGLLDPELGSWAEEKAAATGSKLYVPSGAIGGLDVLKAASVGRIRRLELTTVKNPLSIRPSDAFLEESGFDPGSITTRTLIFEGDPVDAIRYFPRNINVSSILSLAAGSGITPTVRVFIDPEIDRNRHELVMEGDFGRMNLSLDNVPSAETPGTSELAVLSAIATLRSILRRTKIGT